MKLNDKTYKETAGRHLLTSFQSLDMKLTAEAMTWLIDTTIDNDGIHIPNMLLYYDLLCRMRTDSGSNLSFRRPLSLSSGQFQFSEENLANDWNIGRRRIRTILARMTELDLISTTSSRVASFASITSLMDWTDSNGNRQPNPIIPIGYER
jgi:hypothetical protein